VTEGRTAIGWGIAGAGSALAAALVLATLLAGNTARAIRAQGQTVEVKGFAEQRISSDWAEWRGRFTTRAALLADAYAQLERQQALVLEFLRERGVEADSVTLSPVQTQVLYTRNAKGVTTNQIFGYALSLQLAHGSSDIDLIERLARDSGALVKDGIEFTASHPRYLYTRLGELKIDLLAAATADARKRAETLAHNSGGAIGPLRFARQGVFQITPVNSTDVSDYGRNDTSSREKSAKAVVTIRYAIE
jgi:hypothetical protein